MQILPCSSGTKLVRRDGPERSLGPTHYAGSRAPGSSSYVQVPELTRLAEDLSRIELVRHDRVAEVEQLLRVGAYDSASAASETAQIMLDQL
jgi:hypothetical protein